ncbi:MAG: 5'/3'-nucleotidase SurE [Prevotellaceae bacterium]|jgi:5'-nucleotidase|nr:5'/3'-nucleotidase SurE [Prevotellaceae bacterium]
MTKPLILITNDDGIDAKGINALIEMIIPIGDVVVFAPDGARSGMSNAITTTSPLRYELVEKHEGLARYSCNGTPTDCVKLALHEVFTRRPDILLSGINHGSNAAVNVIYSGTVGAAFEGCANNIPSIGLSLDNYNQDADFQNLKPYFVKIVNAALREGLPNGVCLNVNAPNTAINGIRICRQTRGYWAEEFDKRIDPNGRNYFWMTGYFKNAEPAVEQTDEWALDNGYIAVVPAKIDMTDYNFIKELEMWKL